MVFLFFFSFFVFFPLEVSDDVSPQAARDVQKIDNLEAIIKQPNQIAKLNSLFNTPDASDPAQIIEALIDKEKIENGISNQECLHGKPKSPNKQSDVGKNGPGFVDYLQGALSIILSFLYLTN